MKKISTWIRECDEPAFARVAGHYPDVRLLNARTGSAAENPDALLLSGGEDISAKFLRQPVPDPTLIHDADPERDSWEFSALAAALQRRLPIFAVCRGLQVLNVALGGTLHLDIPNHNGLRFENVQPLRYVNGAAIQIPRVNSSHHQALDVLGAGLEIEALCADDDIIEQARLRGHPFVLGVQYHPERDPLYQPLFDAFINHVRQTRP